LGTAWGEACAIEAQSLKILEPLIAARADGGYQLIDKGPVAKALQARFGDVFAVTQGQVQCIELKAEAENKYGNLFLEEWSNRHRWNPGWMQKLDADLLFYHFIEDDEVLILSFPDLREWALTATSKAVPGGRGRMFDYPAKEQTKRRQQNDTWGRCVPIKVIEEEVGLERIRPSDWGQW